MWPLPFASTFQNNNQNLKGRLPERPQIHSHLGPRQIDSSTPNNYHPVTIVLYNTRGYGLSYHHPQHQQERVISRHSYVLLIAVAPPIHSLIAIVSPWSKHHHHPSCRPQTFPRQTEPLRPLRNTNHPRRAPPLRHFFLVDCQMAPTQGSPMVPRETKLRVTMARRRPTRFHRPHMCRQITVFTTRVQEEEDFQEEMYQVTITPNTTLLT